MEDLRIRIVDDMPTNVALIAAIIKKLNARQETAGNGEEALSLIDSFKPHIVLLDLMMPGIDGWDIIKAGATDKPCGEGVRMLTQNCC